MKKTISLTLLTISILLSSTSYARCLYGDDLDDIDQNSSARTYATCLSTSKKYTSTNYVWVRKVKVDDISIIALTFINNGVATSTVGVNQ